VTPGRKIQPSDLAAGTLRLDDGFSPARDYAGVRFMGADYHSKHSFSTSANLTPARYNRSRTTGKLFS
jgi:hypothetical protein